MNKKILFIGDSWVTNIFKSGCPEPTSEIFNFWIENGFNPYFLGSPSRDTQTIIDIWIKYIPYLSKDDLLVIFLPIFGRTRLPNSDYGEHYVNNEIPRFNDYFLGGKSYNPKFNFLEIWGNQYNYEYFSEKLETQELINGSVASILNFTEIIDSLYKITSCKKIVHCWDHKKIDSDVIIYREEMTKLIGEWETRADVHVKTNYEKEKEGDHHWSDEMNMKFMNFLIKYYNNN